MTKTRTDLRIGELLVAAKILTEDDLSEAVKTAQSTGLPIGRVLIMAGFVTESEFQAAVQGQSLLRDSIITLDLAVQALIQVSDKHLSFEEALKASGFEVQPEQESNKLGELLLAAGLVPQEHLDTAMRTSQGTGLPLGRLLVSLGVLSDELLATALNAQSLIRAGRVGRAKALSGLKAAHARQLPLVHNLSEQGFYRGPQRPSIRLGELLVGAMLADEAQISQALERSLIEEKWLGQVLVESGKISSRLLDSALLLQEMVANETLSASQAADALNQMRNGDMELCGVLARMAVPADEFKTKVRFIEVLRVAGLIPPAGPLPARSKPPSSADAVATAEDLLRSGIIDERIFQGALRCYFLIASGWLNMQQGIIALNYFHHKSCSFDEVLTELHWTVCTHIRSE